MHALQGHSFKNFRIDSTKDGVSIVTMDVAGERVNSLSAETNKEFEEIFVSLIDDRSVKAVVLTSGKPGNFIAGANIDMLRHVGNAKEAENMSLSAQEALARLEAARFPVVAAIDGACLGGGLEWAMACRYRVASDNPRTQLGQPEVQIGLIPGAGGTQRLPVLVGVQNALDLILTGKSLRPDKARRLGLVDEVVPSPIVLEVAKRRGLDLAEGRLALERAAHGLARATHARGVGEAVRDLLEPATWTEAALEENPVGLRLLFSQAKKSVLAKSHGNYPAPLKALEAVRVGVIEGPKAGYEMEARLFGELVVSETARRLIEIFKGTNELKKSSGVADARIKGASVKKVGVLGAGLMGGGIGYVAANSGLTVRLKDKDDASILRGLGQVRGLFDERVRRGSLSRHEAADKFARLSATTDYSGFHNCDLIIEAVFEDLELKRRVLTDVEAVVRPECIYASNTSSLPITQIAEASKRPEQVLGMHFFSPVNKMPLLEVIVTKKSSPQATATAVAVGKQLGKTVIVVNDGVGFYTSRIIAPYINEAANVFVEGCAVDVIDGALVEWGFPVGPLVLLDEVGIDVAAKVAHIMQGAFGDRLRAPDAMDKLVADGRTGRKGRKGFYQYPKEGEKASKKKLVDESVYALLPPNAKRSNLKSENIADRIALCMVTEAIRCLEAGILRSPLDGDVGAVLGLGFPPFRGGPFRHVDASGPGVIVDRLEQLRSRYGERFAPPAMLTDMARSGKPFYSNQK
jgi:3-hydroxyacyl-CoA dehydrogenase / enoyl-CoA hydratase / 3-hydroxybutyryl-CoA epimerase